jgi:hypothetical protein
MLFLHRANRCRRALAKRHPERELRLCQRRGHVNPSAVGTRDFGGDVASPARPPGRMVETDAPSLRTGSARPHWRPTIRICRLARSRARRSVVRPRAKSSTLSISADIRATLFCINPRISPAGSFWFSFVSILAPATCRSSSACPDAPAGDRSRTRCRRMSGSTTRREISNAGTKTKSGA